MHHDNITKEAVKKLLIQNNLELKSVQTSLCIPVLNRIYKKMVAGIKFSGIYAKDSLICEGHHRYVASLLSGYRISILPGVTTSATYTVPWKSVILIEEDWDTPAKIKALNEQDARYNNLSIELMLDLLK